MDNLDILKDAQQNIYDKICKFKDDAREQIEIQKSLSENIKIICKNEFDNLIEIYINQIERLEKLDLELKQREHDILIEERENMKHDSCKMKRHRSM